MTPPQFMSESQAFFASCNEGNCSIVSGRYTSCFSSENSQRVGVTAALLAVATVALSLLPRTFVVVVAAAGADDDDDMTTASTTNTAASIVSLRGVVSLRRSEEERACECASSVSVRVARAIIKTGHRGGRSTYLPKSCPRTIDYGNGDNYLYLALDFDSALTQLADYTVYLKSRTNDSPYDSLPVRMTPRRNVSTLRINLHSTSVNKLMTWCRTDYLTSERTDDPFPDRISILRMNG